MSGNVILIGFSATGKSSVGSRLAQRLGWPFVDLDDALVAHFGKSLERVFAEEGEDRFREVERELLAQCCARSGQVLALGGGAVLSAANRELIARGNWVVRLEASPETILQRLQADGDEVRPLLATDDPLSRIRSLKLARAPYYDMADLTLDTDSVDVADLSQQIVERLGLGQWASQS